MKKFASAVVLLIAIPMTAQSVSAASIRSGAICTKIGSTASQNGKLYTCVKNGKKKVWNKGVVLTPISKATPKPTASSDPTPALIPAFVEPERPTSFDDLIAKSEGITYWAWKIVQDRKKNLGKGETKFVINIGPNTTMKVKEPLVPLELTANFFSNRNQVKTTFVTFFDFPDVVWAQALDAKLSTEPRSREVGDSCAAADRCNGGNAYVDSALNGFNYLSSSMKFTNEIVQTNGTVLAHEYFHTLQVLPMQISGKEGKPITWMPDWIREGSAQWISTSLIFDDYSAYMNYRKTDADQELYRNHFTEQQISDVLTINDGRSSNGWLAYNVGAKVIEALVLMKGIDSILEFYDEGARGSSFETAFKKIYQIDWMIAKPILMKAISKQFS